ncbi:MAG: hypothetical protein MRY60_09165, partial [Algiphilus sp.]
VGERHARYTLAPSEDPQRRLVAIDFGGAERMATPGQAVETAYQLGVNRWRGEEQVELILRHLAVR